MTSKSTCFELVGAIVIIAALCLGIYFAWRTGVYPALVVMVPLVALFIWGLFDMLRQGIRQPSAFERFESRLFTRVILILFGGGAAVALLHRAGYDGLALILLVIVLVASLYGAGKLRSRYETSAGYKHRIGYRDPERPQKDDTDRG